MVAPQTWVGTPKIIPAYGLFTHPVQQLFLYSKMWPSCALEGQDRGEVGQCSVRGFLIAMHVRVDHVYKLFCYSVTPAPIVGYS